MPDDEMTRYVRLLVETFAEEFEISLPCDLDRSLLDGERLRPRTPEEARRPKILH